MKRKLAVAYILFCFILTVIMVPAVVFASDITAAQYSGTVRVVNNSTGMASDVLVPFTLNTTSLLADYAISDNCQETAILTNAGADTAYMPVPGNTTSWLVYVSSIVGQSSIDYTFYAGGSTNMDAEIRYFPDDDGMSANDSATLELGDDFYIEQSGFVDTSPKSLNGISANFSCWLKFGDVNSGRIGINDGTDTTWSSYHTGSGNWELLSVANTFNLTASRCRLIIEGDPNNGTADDATLSPDYLTIINADMEETTGWTGGSRTAANKHSGSYGWSVGVGQVYQDAVWKDYLAYKPNALEIYVASSGDIIASINSTETVNATGVSSGEHVYNVSMVSPFIAIGVDTSDNLTPISDNLVFNAPMWQTELDADPFTSIDDNGHSCNVTGANWTSAGYAFDATDDLITVTDAASVQNIFDDGGTIEAWINVASGGENNAGVIASKLWMFFTRNGIILHFRYNFSGTQGQWEAGSVVTANTSTHIVLTYDNSDVGNDPILYINGSVASIPEIQTPVGTRTTDVGTNLVLGNTPATSQTLDGAESEVRFYNRILTSDEVTRNYNTTVWKYNGSTSQPLASSSTGVPDNSETWTFVEAAAMPYMEYHTITINGTVSQNITWQNNQHIFTDLSGTGNDVTPTFRTASSNSSVSANLTTYEPISEAAADNWTTAEAGQMLTGNVTTPTGMYTELQTDNLIGADVVNDALDEGGVPRAMFWFPIPFLIIVAIGMAIGSSTKSLFLQVIVMTVAMAFFAATALPFWIVIVFTLDSIAVMIASRQFSF